MLRPIVEFTVYALILLFVFSMGILVGAESTVYPPKACLERPWLDTTKGC